MTRREEALGYVERGWALLPLRPRSKTPHNELLRHVHGLRGWAPLAKRPASAPEVSAWFDVDPATNVGILTGAPSQLIVADFDRPSDLDAPITPTVRTARGRHLYYGTDCGRKTRRFDWGELKGDGGYVTAPPSQHESGAMYAWETSPDQAQLARVDAFLALLGSSTSDVVVDVKTPRQTYALPMGVVPSEALEAHELGRDPAAVEIACARVLQLGASVGSAFRCVLPGHSDARPSAAVWLKPGGHHLYHDLHRQSGRQFYELPEVLASIRAGHIVQLSPSSQRRWWDRLFWEAGLLDVAPAALPSLPSDADEVLRRVAQGFAILVALQAQRDPDEPVVFARHFAAAWCGVSEQQARRAIIELQRRGVIEKVGEHCAGGRRHNLWVPGRGLRR